MKQLLQLTGALTLGFAFMACQNNSGKPENAAAAKMDSLVATKPSTECVELKASARHVDSLILSSGSLNKALAEQALIAFENYATTCKDSMAPVFLMKAGQVAQTVMNLDKAKALYTTCISDFPDYKNRGAAMFLLARLYDEPTMLNNEAEAKKLYEQIIREYPSTAWSQDAKAAIQNLGKSDEELIKEFMKKNGDSKEKNHSNS